MKKHAPDVGQYMTHLPVEAERCQSVADARELMRKHRIHHIPVMNGSKLKGIVSAVDLLRAYAEGPGGDESASLERFCQTDVLTCSPVTPIDDVARQLLDRSDDSAVVMDGGFVVGIFTTTDLLRFVGEFFGQTA